MAVQDITTEGKERGCWVKGSGETRQIYYPDVNAMTGELEHWDYKGPKYPNGIRIKPDGSFEHKPPKPKKTKDS